MKLEGGCYCGKVRYMAEGEPMLKAQCHCRECQYITGGAPNMFIVMPQAGFTYTKGAPKQFTRSDLEKPVTRAFCRSQAGHAQRPGEAGDAGVLSGLRHPSGHAAATSGHRREGRHA